MQVQLKQGVNVKRAIKNVIATVLILYVGSEILSAVVAGINITNSYFKTAFTFLGLGTSDHKGILGVIGLIAVAEIVLEFVDISF